MKKLLSLLSVLTIIGTAVPTTIAASHYQKKEKINSDINLQTNNLEILSRNKRSVSSYDYCGGVVKVKYQASWFTYWELEFDNTAAEAFYDNFKSYYSENQIQDSFEQFKRFFNGVTPLKILTVGFIPIGRLWITGVANRAHIENRGNGVIFGFKTLALDKVRAL